MAEVSTSPADQDPLWSKRWVLLASMLAVLVALALLVSMNHAQWSWPLFFWGVAVGVAGFAIIVALIYLVIRRETITEVQRLLLRRRFIIYTCCWITAGLTCGMTSAMFDQAWIDIAAAAYVAVMTLGAGLVAFRRRSSLRQRG